MTWHWDRRDFGYRFSDGRGRNVVDYYQGPAPGQYYRLPRKQRKVPNKTVSLYYNGAKRPDSCQEIPCPWQNYHRAGDWDQWIVDADGHPINYAGCLDQVELQWREDIGVAQALKYVRDAVGRKRVTLEFVVAVHRQMLGDIYPLAGRYRTVELSKGGHTWPLPPNGIEPHMQQFERDILDRTPFISADLDQVCQFVAEFMNELLAIHPFREGNGRTARLVGSLIFLQNALPPISEWQRGRDEKEYIAACQAGLIGDNERLAVLLRRWLDAALEGEGS